MPGRPSNEKVVIAVKKALRSLFTKRTVPSLPPALQYPVANPVLPRELVRPEQYRYPLFVPYRGALRTTQDGAQDHLAAEAGPLFALAGILWPAREYLNKIALITGRPGSGKTVMMRMMLESAGKLFTVLREMAQVGLYPGQGDMRWLVVDPTNAYLPLLYQVVPGDVPIVRATPQDAEGWRWDIAKDVTSPSLNEALQAGLFPDSLFKKAGDPFWYTKARAVTEGVVTVYLERKSDWAFHDIVIPIKYPQFLRPLLVQSPRTHGLAEQELVGKLGRDIVSTSSSVVNKLAIAAALWRKATRSFSLREFLDSRSVLHLGYTPDLIPCLAGIGNALVHVLVLLGIKRNDEYNHTLLWLDEGRYLADIAGLEDIAARGRGAGIGEIIAAQGLAGLIKSWGEERVRELLDVVNTWCTLSAGHATAREFSQFVGQIEGLQESYGFSHSTTFSETWGTNWGRSGTWSPSGGSFGSNSGGSHSVARSTSSSSSQNFQLTIKDAILASEVTSLPLASKRDDRISGFAFNPEVGAFEFDIPFLHHFENLPDPPFTDMPLRPDADQRLDPWTEEDIRRLKLEPTPELIQAVKATWNQTGGKR